MRTYQKIKISKLANTLEKMDKDAAAGSLKGRKRRVSAHNGKTEVNPCDFVTGNLVFRGVVRHAGSKIQVKWVGPMRVTACLSYYLFELQDLWSLTKKTVHGSRVSFFRNKDLQVTEEVSAYLSFQEGEYCAVNQFLSIREHDRNMQLLHEYRVFEEEEPVRWDLQELLEDVPLLVQGFLHDLKKNGTQQQRDLGTTSTADL